MAVTTTYRYTLRIERPDEIDAGTLAEIEYDADEQDTTLDAKVARWLGGDIEDAERLLTDNLPEGWYAAIDSDD